jgi:hypothetical protein
MLVPVSHRIWLKLRRSINRVENVRPRSRPLHQMAVSGSIAVGKSHNPDGRFVRVAAGRGVGGLRPLLVAADVLSDRGNRRQRARSRQNSEGLPVQQR